jgi:hypothetical protein
MRVTLKEPIVAGGIHLSFTLDGVTYSRPRP